MRIGIIGYGRMAREYERVVNHLGYSVCCFLRKNLSWSNPLPIKTNDWEVFLSHKPEAIIIAVPINETVKMLEKAIETNLPILVEKPVSKYPNVLYAFREKYKNQVMVGYNRRYYKVVEYIKTAINSEKKLASVFVNISEDLLYSGVHVLDLLFYLFGEIILEHNGGNPPKSYLSLLVTYKNSIHILLQVNENASSNTEMRFTFEDGVVYNLKPIEVLIVNNDFYKIKNTKTGDRKYVPKATYYKDEKQINDFKCGLLEQVKDFLSFDNRRNIACDLTQAGKVLELYEEIKGEKW